MSPLEIFITSLGMAVDHPVVPLVLPAAERRPADAAVAARGASRMRRLPPLRRSWRRNWS